jgi:hypothetical protein
LHVAKFRYFRGIYPQLCPAEFASVFRLFFTDGRSGDPRHYCRYRE